MCQSKRECSCRHLVLATHIHSKTLAFLPPHTWVNDSVQLFHLIVVYTAWERMSGIYWLPVFYFTNEWERERERERHTERVCVCLYVWLYASNMCLQGMSSTSGLFSNESAAYFEKCAHSYGEWDDKIDITLIFLRVIWSEGQKLQSLNNWKAISCLFNALKKI